MSLIRKHQRHQRNISFSVDNSSSHSLTSKLHKIFPKQQPHHDNNNVQATTTITINDENTNRTINVIPSSSNNIEQSKKAKIIKMKLIEEQRIKTQRHKKNLLLELKADFKSKDKDEKKQTYTTSHTPINTLTDIENELLKFKIQQQKRKQKEERHKLKKELQRIQHEKEQLNKIKEHFASPNNEQFQLMYKQLKEELTLTLTQQLKDEMNKTINDKEHKTHSKKPIHRHNIIINYSKIKNNDNIFIQRQNSMSNLVYVPKKPKHSKNSNRSLCKGSQY